MNFEVQQQAQHEREQKAVESLFAAIALDPSLKQREAAARTLGWFRHETLSARSQEEHEDLHEKLAAMGVQISMQHFTGDSSYPTVYTLIVGEWRGAGPILLFAFLDFVEQLLKRQQTAARLIESVFELATPGPVKNSLWAAYQGQLPGGVRKQQHRLCRSSRVPGRFALDTPDGQTLSSFHPVLLKRGPYWLAGHIDGDDESYCFVPDGGTWKQDRIELRDGDIVRA